VCDGNQKQRARFDSRILLLISKSASFDAIAIHLLLGFAQETPRFAWHEPESARVCESARPFALKRSLVFCSEQMVSKSEFAVDATEEAVDFVVNPGLY